MTGLVKLCRSFLPAFAVLILAAIAVTLPSASAATPCATSVIDASPRLDEVNGTKCADIIIASPSTETINAGKGNDLIIGAPGVDYVIAGEGNDIILANGSTTVIGGDGNDRIYGTEASQPVGAVPAPALHKLRASIGATRATRILRAARTRARPSTRANDCTYCDETDNIFYGGGGNDEIHGLGGPDRLYGDSGDDEVYGDDGNDFVSGGHGYDTVSGGYGNDYVRGDGGGDRILNDPGSNDTLSYSTGATPGFDESITTYNFPAAGTDGGRGVYVNLSAEPPFAKNGKAIEGGGDDKTGSDYLHGFENVIGSAFSDFIVGNGSANDIYAGGGSDIVWGAGGADRIFGGASGDNLSGNDGDDTIFGGPGWDYCELGAGDYTPSSCNDGGGWEGSNRVVPKQTNGVSVGMQTDNSSGLDYREVYVTGTPSADTIDIQYQRFTTPKQVVVLSSSGTGIEMGGGFESTPGCNYDNAETAWHMVICPAGNVDAIVVSGGGGNDSVTFNNSDLDYEPYRWTSPLLFGGDGNDTLKSTDATDDVLVDGNGNDKLYGFNMNDVLINSQGVDELYAGSGWDLLLSNTRCEGDILDGGAGDADDASWAQLKNVGIHADLTSGGDGLFGQFSDDPEDLPVCPGGTRGVMHNMENLEGSPQNDRLIGDSGNNRVMGHDGDDRLRTGGGNDVLSGNEGNDIYQAGDGNDTVNNAKGNQGSPGFDSEGSDYVDCGAGNDTSHTDSNDNPKYNCNP